ncbi:MAG TPA: efflux RND transporter permease subunit [Gammaproteobacteria bacterium]|nr:efflux RND transporter permease subunit [Gammaproteobacteria bacterium]
MTEFFIRRPAFTIVISLLLAIVGIIGYSHLPVRWVPNINPPYISIYTDYPGASASLIETQITTPIEAALAGVNGIEALSSSSRQDASFINIEFKLGRNINSSVEDVRSALQRVSGTLPKDAKNPVIEKADPNSNPIMFIAFLDLHRSAEEVSNYVKQFVLPRFQTIDGVATVSTYGERASAMHIWLDPMKMAAMNVTVDDVESALTQQNVQVPSGKIRGATRFYSIVTNETLKSANEFNDLIIRDNQSQIVRLKDIGQAVVDALSTDTIFRVNGKPAVALAIIPQSTANPLDVANSLTTELKQIIKTLPEGMQANIAFNPTTYIKSSIHHVYQSLIESIILVLLVIFLFLASWRAAIIPIVTIPICLIATFAVMYYLQISINTITLMAFVLAIGLVVDDAIVMLENITRHIESGMRPFAAAIKGSREIVFPVIAMTITLVAVYAPIAFTSGMLGAVFWEFAITLAAAVLLSGIVALTLSPMMSARFLKKSDLSHYGEWLHANFHILQNKYQAFLSQTLIHKKRILSLLGGMILLGFFTYHLLPSELSPMEDMNEIDAYIKAPRDSSFQYTDSYIHQLEDIYKKIPEIQSYVSQGGFWAPSSGMQFINLVPREKRSRNEMNIMQEIEAKTNQIAGVQVNMAPATSPLMWFSDSDGTNVSMRILSAMDYKNLHDVMQRFIQKARTYPGFSHVDSSLKWDGSQFEVSINRDKAADAQVSMQDITNTISTFLAGRNTGHFEYDGNLYDIIMQMNMSALSNPNIISELYVRNANSKMVPLSDLVSIQEKTSPESLPHYDRLRADTLHASLLPGYTIADAVDTLQKMAKEVLPDNAKYEFEGEAKSYLDSSSKMNMTFLLAMIFIYLVLVAQFESFIDPLIILLTVPFAMIGALLTLKIAGGSLNIYSNIALVTLIGLIAKHGILITEFANQQLLMGKSVEEAAIEAAKLRLRPILMTTAAMVLGALPLAFATGPGAETRHQIGWVITGGLLFGTLFSLIVIPLTYTLFKKKQIILKAEI